MIQNNGYWIDKNCNKWNCDEYTREQAMALSKTLVNCFDCVNCRYCSDCNSCHDCSDYKKNPQRYVTSNIGPRNDQTYFYWTDNDNIQVVCGYFKDNLKEFENAILKIHKNNKYAEQYKNEIQKIKYLIGVKEDNSL